MLEQTVVIQLDYFNSLHQRYQAFSHLPGFVLLESSDKLRGRYDILSACPYDRILVKNTGQDLDAALNKLNQILSVKETNHHLPFQGGAIGYVSYDLGATLLGLSLYPQPSLSDMPLLDLGLYDWAIISDHEKRETNLVIAHQHQSSIELIPELIHLWQNPDNCIDKKFKVNSEFTPLISKDSYFSAIQTIKQDLKVGRSYQVNYTQPFLADYSGDSWALYRHISIRNPVPFAAYMRTPSADLLSFSPERLLLYESGTLLSSPIKGTTRRSPDDAEDLELTQQLLNCPKNRAENVMIVDLIRNDLGKIAKSGSVKVTTLCEIQSFQYVHHLVSDIQADCLDSVSPMSAFMSCFPGGSITGAPKIESMKIINELEAHSRGVYCGSIGYFSNHGRFDTNIAIRTITAKDGKLHLSAGGGIVIDSFPEDEYRECFTKIAAIINGLNNQ
jgi:para-aminobenzoate synthetase component I